MTEKDAALRRSETHVKHIRDFYYHLMVFVFVAALLVIIDVAGGANAGFLGMDFAYWVILPWSLGVAGHAIYAFFGESKVTKTYVKEKEREKVG
ncbi:MAG TPA: 2TM domain-containing protein [Acidimicrobiia bacterium]|jgi:hypothetical protein